jgi:hypothetical protein
VRHDAQRGDNVVEQCAHLVRDALERELARLHARQVEIVVDQRQQVLAVARDDRGVAQALLAPDFVA